MTSPHQRFPHASRLAVAFVTIVGLLALGLAGFKLFGPSVHDSAAPNGVKETLQVLVDATLAAPTAQSIATLPTITPSQQTAGPIEPAPRAGYAAASRPALDPHRSTTPLPTVAPSPVSKLARTGCDPAYPEERTCIPPGPPLAQPCAITDERNFTVLPPDPRGLDRDRNGIGCEPVSP